MKVYVKLHQPPVTPYWSIAMSIGGSYIVAQIHWSGETGEKEFGSMKEFGDWARENNIKIPWEEE